MYRLKIDLKSVCQQEASVRDNILFIKKENFSQKKNNFSKSHRCLMPQNVMMILEKQDK